MTIGKTKMSLKRNSYLNLSKYDFLFYKICDTNSKTIINKIK